MIIRNDIEVIVADMVAAYLQATLAAETQADCPVVSWHDPMSIDDANRVVVMVPQCVSAEENPGNYECTVEVGIKSQWSQPTVAADKESHFARVDAVRDALWTDTLVADLAAQSTVVGVNFVSPRRNHTTKIVDGFFYSETALTIHIYTREV